MNSKVNDDEGNGNARSRSAAYFTWFRQYKESADIEDLRGQRNN